MTFFSSNVRKVSCLSLSDFFEKFILVIVMMFFSLEALTSFLSNIVYGAGRTSYSLLYVPTAIIALYLLYVLLS